MTTKTNYIVRFLLIVVGVAAASNLLFFALHYASLSVPQDFIKARVAQGFKDQNLVHESYPSHRYGFSSNYTGVGINHFTDCRIILMTLYRHPDRLRNAVIPKLAGSEDTHATEPCETVASFVNDKVTISESASNYYLRYWYGAKVFLSIALRYLDFFQINQLIKTFTYIGFFLLAAAIVAARRDLLLQALPVGIFGIGCFGINYHGGIAMPLPFLLAVYLLLGIVLLRNVSLAWLGFYFAVAGALSSFVYFLGGSLILFFAFAIYLLHFINFADHPLRQRYAYSAGMLACFGGAFAGSLLFKQLVSTLYISAGRVFSLFWSGAFYRMSGSFRGESITIADAIEKQIEYYRLAVFNWETGAELIGAFSLGAWIVSLLITVYLFYGKRNVEQLHRFAIIFIAGILVFVRYALFRNHTYIHVIFIGRYLTVFYLFGWVALAQAAQGLASYVPAIGARTQTVPAPLLAPEYEERRYRKHRNLLHVVLAGAISFYLLFRIMN